MASGSTTVRYISYHVNHVLDGVQRAVAGPGPRNPVSRHHAPLVESTHLGTQTSMGAVARATAAVLTRRRLACPARTG